MAKKERYRLVLLGFKVNRATWDQNTDGRADEVEVRVSGHRADKDGRIIGVPVDEENATKVHGDTSWGGDRVKAGSATGRNGTGGLQTGDQVPASGMLFPSEQTPFDPIPLNKPRTTPPCLLWQGVLEEGEIMAFVSPSIWEWDEGEGVFNKYMRWVEHVNEKFGKKAKEIFAGRFPLIGWIFDAVDLGIQTAATLDDEVVGIFGRPGHRPIGMRRPEGAQGGPYEYGAKVLALTNQTAEEAVNDNSRGLGPGVFALTWRDDEKLAGVYEVYFRLERAGGNFLEFVDDRGARLDVVDAGQKPAGASHGVYFNVVNRGPVPVRVLGTHVEGGGDVFEPMGFPVTLSRGVPSQLGVWFSPEAEGDFDSVFALRTEGGDREFSQVRIPVKAAARGVAPTVLHAWATGGPLKFGPVTVTIHAVDKGSGEAVDAPVQIEIPGMLPLNAGRTNQPLTFTLDPRPIVAEPPGPGELVIERPNRVIARIVDPPDPYIATAIDLGRMPMVRRHVPA